MEHNHIYLLQVVHSEARKAFVFNVPKPLPPLPVPVKRARTTRLLPQDIAYCVHMMENYGEDFEVRLQEYNFLSY